MKRLLQASFFLLFGFLISFGGFNLIAYQLVDHFRLGKIEGKLQKKRADPLPACINQPFFYLGKGSQSYVFESSDGQYVLKFFRMNRYRVAQIVYIPPFFKEMQEEKRVVKQKKLDDLFTSCHIAFKRLAKQTAIVYLHLEESANLNQKVLIHDALSRPYLIDLDKTPFIIQKKAVPLYVYLEGLIKEKKTSEVCVALIDLKNLLISRFERQVSDHDPVIEKNAGYLLDGRPIFMDIGQFYLSEKISSPSAYRQEGAGVLRKLKIWLEEQDSYYAEIYLDCLKI